MYQNDIKQVHWPLTTDFKTHM